MNTNQSAQKVQSISNKKQERFKQQVYHQKQEVRRNQIAVHLFYIDVLKEYIKRLTQRAQNGQKSIIINKNQIQNFHSAIKYYYNYSNLVYQQCVDKRQSSERNIQNQHFNILDCSLISQQVRQQSQASQFHLNTQFYNPQLNKLFECKKQIIKKDKQQQQIINNQQNTQSSDQDSDYQYRDYSKKAEQLTNSLIMGEFLNNQMKRRPKQQKIFLQLQDVFLKLQYNGRDLFCDRACMLLNHIPKAKAPLS